MIVKLLQRTHYCAVGENGLTIITGNAGDEVEAGIYGPALIAEGKAQPVKKQKESAKK